MSMRELVLLSLARVHTTMADGCQLILFRHVQKTGGTTIRQLFRQLSMESDARRGGWRVAVPYTDLCTSYYGWRRTLLTKWIADQAARVDRGPNVFIEYHVGYDGAEQFYEDLYAAREAQTARCRVLAVAILRNPSSWIRSRFKADVNRYRAEAGGPVAPHHSQLSPAAYAHAMCAFVRHVHSLWKDLAAWGGGSNSRKQSEADAKVALKNRSIVLGVSLHSDDETANHTDSQTGALLWRVAQFNARRGAETYALRTGAQTRFDVLGVTEHLEAFVSEIFARSGHAARPPLPGRVGALTASSLRLTTTNASDGCPDLASAVDGGADEVFDRFARQSTRDQEWWRDATQRAVQVEARRLLPVLPFGEPEFAWAVHDLATMKASQLTTLLPPGAGSNTSESSWDVLRLPPSGRRPNGTLCARATV